MNIKEVAWKTTRNEESQCNDPAENPGIHVLREPRIQSLLTFTKGTGPTHSLYVMNASMIADNLCRKHKSCDCNVCGSPPMTPFSSVFEAKCTARRL